MIFAVMSDTHGNLGLMHDAIRLMTCQFYARAIFHLGDDYRDANDLDVLAPGCITYRVPGLWCPEYHSFKIPKTIIQDFGPVSVACAHAQKDLRAPELAAGIILTGHTHNPEIELIGRSLYVNPGHLKSLTSRGSAARLPSSISIQLRSAP